MAEYGLLSFGFIPRNRVTFLERIQHIPGYFGPKGSCVPFQPLPQQAHPSCGPQVNAGGSMEVGWNVPLDFLHAVLKGFGGILRVFPIAGDPRAWRASSQHFLAFPGTNKSSTTFKYKINQLWKLMGFCRGLKIVYVLSSTWSHRWVNSQNMEGKNYKGEKSNEPRPAFKKKFSSWKFQI